MSGGYSTVLLFRFRSEVTIVDRQALCVGVADGALRFDAHEIVSFAGVLVLIAIPELILKLMYPESE